jgi:hypothetical protein
MDLYSRHKCFELSSLCFELSSLSTQDNIAVKQELYFFSLLTFSLVFLLNFRDVECYNPKKDEWTFVKEMHSCRDGACVVSDGMFIYAISGYDGNNYLSSVEVYDPSSDKWTVGGRIT